MDQADTDDNGGARLTSAEKKELSELRRKNRQLELENEILKRAAAYFARENVLPKQGSRWSVNSPLIPFRSRWPAEC
jgi:transposase-like protein